MIAAEVVWLSRLVTAENSMVIYGLATVLLCIQSSQRERTAGMGWSGHIHTLSSSLSLPAVSGAACEDKANS